MRHGKVSFFFEGPLPSVSSPPRGLLFDAPDVREAAEADPRLAQGPLEFRRLAEEFPHDVFGRPRKGEVYAPLADAHVDEERVRAE